MFAGDPACEPQCDLRDQWLGQWQHTCQLRYPQPPHPASQSIPPEEDSIYPRFYHYRDKDKVEVDIIIENAQGDCFAIEVKAAASLKSKDFNGLKHFRNVAGERFKFGVLLYDGDHSGSFGDNLFAVPLGALWA